MRVSLESNFAKLAKEIKGRITEEVVNVAQLVEADASDAIQRGPKTGREYRRRKNPKGPKHKASAPGEAPATDEGNLVASLESRGLGPRSMLAEVSAAAEYAAALEFGTSDGHIAPRPFLGPALKGRRDDLEARVAKAVAQSAEENAL